MKKAVWVLWALGFLFVIWLRFAFGPVVFIMFSVFVTLFGVSYEIARAFAAFLALVVPMVAFALVFVFWIWRRIVPAKKI